ncbi:MAG: hypothetical protein GY696_32150 [Gammaproteobacteria bacterium]|nr:hypothetical protein [Gammaproteobacteria bacterium]
MYQATPLGVVPGRNGASVLPQPEPLGLGTVPTRRVIDTSRASGGGGSGSERQRSTDFDETEPLGVLTVPAQSRGSSRENMSGSIESLTTSPLPIPFLEGGDMYSPQWGNTPQHRVAAASGQLTASGHPGFGQMPGGHPGFGQVPGGHPGFGQLPGGHPGLGQLPGGHPGLGQPPGGYPGLGQLPGGHPGGHPGIQPLLLSSQASTTTSITTSSLALAMATEVQASAGQQADGFIGSDDELMQEFCGGGGSCAGLEPEELEPTQSMSITSSSFSRFVFNRLIDLMIQIGFIDKQK